MTLASWTFGAFLALTFAVYWLAPAVARIPILLGASLVFYMWAFPVHAAVLGVLGLGTWLVGRRLGERPDSALLLGWSVAAIVAVLALFKYSDMAAQTASIALAAAGVPALELPRIVAPLGISYATFGLIHYLVEIRRGHATPARPLEFALYVFFFPTIVSGPIKRYPEFLADMRQPVARLAASDVGTGLTRILMGLFKKVVLADLLMVWVTPLTTSPVKQRPLVLLVAVYAYAFVIYLDFSGYSDMAIGIARLFGYRILENFDHPYLRRNLSQFWRHWHISLTRFITENVYIPLGGNRKGTVRTALNTMASMLVSGLWHGAAWHFVLWGGVHGAGMVVQRWWQVFVEQVMAPARTRTPAISRVVDSRPAAWTSQALSTALTFNFVSFAWVLFLLPLSDALVVYERIARGLVAIAAKVVG